MGYKYMVEATMAYHISTRSVDYTVCFDPASMHFKMEDQHGFVFSMSMSGVMRCTIHKYRNLLVLFMAKGAAVVPSRSASPGELASERTSTEASQESHPDSGL